MKNMGEVTDHLCQLQLVARWFEENDWHVEKEYTLRNRRIDLVAWYKYDNIIFLTEVKTDLLSEITNAIGQLQTAKALMMYYSPSHEIYMGISAPQVEYEKTGDIAVICENSNVFLINNYDGKIQFTNRIKGLSFKAYMAYKLWKITNQDFPHKLDKLLNTLDKYQRKEYDSIVQIGEDTTNA